MKEFTINANDAGQRVDKFLTKAVPLLPQNLLYKYNWNHIYLSLALSPS